MNRFREQLRELGLGEILEPVAYEYPGFTGDERFFAALDDIIKNNKSVLIHPDSDPDGAYSAKIMHKCLAKLGHTNMDIYRLRERSHKLTDMAVNEAIYNKYDYMIILDSSTNDMYNITKLTTYGVIPIVLDHHVGNYDLNLYPKDAIIINTIYENAIRGHEEFRLCGGGLTFCLVSEYLRRNNRKYSDLAPYALVALYADCIDMTKGLNRSIYYMATSVPRGELPPDIKYFLEDYAVFSRRFIEFTLVPKINALFRTENLELLNQYLFDNLSYDKNIKLVALIKDLHSFTREQVLMLTDVVEKRNLENIVLANLTHSGKAVQLNKLYNYTGLVANNISTEYGKPCVVLCDTGDYIKASFRDLLSRNYLPIFKQFCNAEGHGAAFAINIPYNTYREFITYLENTVDRKFSIAGVDEPIEVECDSLMPDLELIEDVALFNEFSGIKVPIAILKKKNNLTCKSSYSKSHPYNYKWGDYNIESSSRLIPGRVIKIKPVKTKSLKLIVYNRNVAI